MWRDFRPSYIKLKYPEYDSFELHWWLGWNIRPLCKGSQAAEFFWTDFLTNIFQKNVYSENLWLCDNENSYIFEMSYDDI